MKNYVLQKDPPPDQSSWNYQLTKDALTSPKGVKSIGKYVKFTPDSITFHLGPLPNNRILQTDEPSKFILASFSDLRWPDVPMRVGSDYINRLMKAGFFLNGVQYRFYHHSNSQLVCTPLIPVWFTIDCVPREVAAVSCVKQTPMQNSMKGYTSLVISARL